METPSIKQLLVSPLILASYAVVVLIAIASAFYYIQSTRVPNVQALMAHATSTTAVTGSGTVQPAQNPTLAFANGGRVTSVRVLVGQKVNAGALLASLDTASLAAQRAQAVANTEAAAAKLADMLAGARKEDIAAKQTAVDQATNTRNNAYATVATTIAQSYDKAFSGLSQNTDTLFGQANTNNPVIAFSTTNSQAAQAALTGRTAAQAELAKWQSESDALSSTSSHADIDAALAASLSHLSVVRKYDDQLLTALMGAVVSGSFTQNSINTAQQNVGAYRDTVNSLIASLQSAAQQLSASELAVQAAQNALSQVTATATTEQIAAQKASVAAAQANADSINAQIQNDIIIAPFSGTVASVLIKPNDVVAANTPAISLNPESALQIVVYFSEIDITKVHVGDLSQVTLDAYGQTKTFAARVVSVDSAPSRVTNAQGGTGYKATFQFLTADPSIAAGMTANVTLTNLAQ